MPNPRKERWLSLTAILAATFVGPVAIAGTLHTDGQWIKDSAGNTVILRGANVSNSSKDRANALDGGFHTHNFGSTDALNLRAWGFNVMRLVLNWDALEPYGPPSDSGACSGSVTTFAGCTPPPGQECSFDPCGYLASEVDPIIAAAAGAGVFVVLDMHQDIWGARYGGDGAPEWATLDLGAPDPWSNPQNPARSTWQGQYFMPAPNFAFNNFYLDMNGIQDAFVDLWKRLAERYKGDATVVGFDLFNEPTPSELLTPGGELVYLYPLYDRLVGAVRGTGSNQIVFFEPLITKSVNAPEVVPYTLPGALSKGANLVYAPHIYPLEGTVGFWQPGDPWPPSYMADTAAEASVMGVPWWIGETGAPLGMSNLEAYLSHLYDLQDAHGVGSVIWSYDRPAGNANTSGPFNLLDDQGQPTIAALTAARAYPMQVPGTLQSFFFEASSSSLTVHFTGAGDLVIATPTHRYPKGAVVTVDDGIPQTLAASPRTTVSIAGAGLHKVQVAPAP